MNELSTVLISVLGTLTPLLGGGVWMYRRQTKRLKTAEAELAEVNVTKAKADMAILNREADEKRFAELHRILDVLNGQLLAKTKECEGKEAIITDKTLRIRELTGQTIDLQTKMMCREQYISAQQRFIDWLKNWHCAREYGKGKEDCTRRKPEQQVKVSYDPPPEMGECDLPVIAETLNVNNETDKNQN